MIFSSAFFSIPASSWVWLIAASIGAIIVFAGLLMEKIAERKTEKHIPSFIESHKWLENLGWIFLMVGILVEIGVGFVLAAKEKKDIDAAKNAWQTQRIYAFEATATIVVRPLQPVTDFASLPKAPPNALTFPQQTQSPKKDDSLIFLNLGRSVDIAKGAYSRENAEIQDDEAYRSAAGDNLIRFDIHFGGHHENFFENKVGNTWEFFNDSLTPEDLDAIDLVLPIRCEVISGEVKMEIDNGLTNMVFQIPKQTTFVCAATSVATNGTFVPINFSPEIRAQVGKSEEVERKKTEAQAEFLSRGIELEAIAHEGKSNDRTITDEQRGLFIKLLSEYPKTPVRVFAWSGDNETEKYAQQISQLLQAASYGNGEDIIRMGNTNGNFTSQVSPNALIFLTYGNPTNAADSVIPISVPFNDIKPVISSGLTNEANMFHRGILDCVKWAFSGIGLNGDFFMDDTKLKSGEVGIIVMPKNH
jgi:hypothetical protein